MHIPEKGPIPAHRAGERPAEGLRQSSQANPHSHDSGGPGRDTVRLTDNGREFTRAIDQARSLPDVRADRVAQLKHQLDQGTYRVEGNRIAVSMIDESVENNTVLNRIDTKV